MNNRMAERSIFRIRRELYVLTASLFFGDFGTGILMPLIPLYIRHLDAGMSLDLEIKSASTSHPRTAGYPCIHVAP